MESPTWDEFFMGMAEYVSQKSKDRSRKVGAVIVDQRHSVLSLGWNGFPRGVDDDVDSRHSRPDKYLYTEHAERNALFNALPRGVPLQGGIFYVNWYPCCDCARAIIQSGIVELICLEPDWGDPTWKDGFAASMTMMDEAGIKVTYMGKYDKKPK